MPPSNTAQITITANSRQLPAGLAAAMSAMRGFARGVQTVMGAAARAPLNVARQVAHEVGRELVWGMTRRGMDALIEQGQEVLSFREQLVRFGLAARKTPQELAAIEAAMRATSNATGLGALAILKGTRAYVDIAGAEQYTTEKMQLLARVAQASGSDMAQLAQVMYQLQHAMHIDDKDLESTFSGLLNMSKDGTIHFAQMAEEINELAPQFARFGVTGRDGMMQLAAMMQIVRSGFASVAETGTGMTRIFQGLNMHSDKFEKYGVKIFNVGKNGVKTFRPFLQILDDIRTNDVLSKDPHLLRKAFGRGEAERGIRLLFEGWLEAMEKFRRSGEATDTVMQDLGTYTASASGRIAIAMEKAKNSVADALTPERVERFTTALEGMVDKTEDALGAVGKLSDGWMWLFNVGKRIRRAITDVDADNPFGSKDRDARIREYEKKYSRTPKKFMDGTGYASGAVMLPDGTIVPTPTEAERTQYSDDANRRGVSDSWSLATKRLIALTPNDAVTDTAIRAAYAMSHATWPGGAPDTGAQTAGRQFLEQAPPALVDKIVKAIEAEIRTDAATRRGAYSQAAQDIADVVSRALDSRTGDAPRRIVWHDHLPTVRVDLDGRPLAKSVRNDPNRRRSP